MDCQDLKQYYENNADRIIDEYFTFLKFPSISADPKYKKDIQNCWEWLSAYLQQMGFTIEIWPTSSNPVIYASHLKAGPQKPTVLIYNHYDVQPADPEKAWKHPPFEPHLSNGQVYARGAQDNKGQCWYTLQALRALLESGKGALPVNCKLCIEGDEEVGSGGLMQIAASKRAQLQADHLLVPDFGLQKAKEPCVTLGLRGVLTMSVEVTGSFTDAHSGEHGGILYNPLRALSEMMAHLYDDKGQVAIPEFYDDISPLTPQEKEVLDFSFDQARYEKLMGARPTGGERDFSPLERGWIRPTLEINGLWGGYNGDGFKTVIPAKAYAKISCRLVPNQDPKKVLRLVKEHLQTLTPEGISLQIEAKEMLGEGFRTSATSPIVKAVKQAYEEIYANKCRCILSGGSVNIVKTLSEFCQGKVVMLGLALPSDNIHAPNEHFGLDRMQDGICLMARILQILPNCH